MTLRISHFPQVPCKPFQVEVQSVEEAVRLMDILANYDQFQLDYNIKPDYCNATVLEMFENGEWVTWYDEETGIDDPQEYLDELEKTTKK
jgi:hypothetical protein